MEKSDGDAGASDRATMATMATAALATLVSAARQHTRIRVALGPLRRGGGGGATGIGKLMS